jgi:hypothetical protein
MAHQQTKKFKKLTEKVSAPRLSEANKTKILDWLHTTAKRNLFGTGSWPADDRTKQIYWVFFKRYLSITTTSRKAWYLTQFAQEIDVVSLGAFIGVDLESCLSVFDWDQAGEAELEDLIDEILEGDGDPANEKTKRYLRGAYIRYCAAHGIHPFAN